MAWSAFLLLVAMVAVITVGLLYAADIVPPGRFDRFKGWVKVIIVLGACVFLAINFGFLK